MTKPLQSPEYAALVAAKEARDAAYATLENRAKEFLATSPMTLDAGAYARSQIYKAGQDYEVARIGVTIAELDFDKAQAAFDAAYPAPADVVTAVDAVRSGHEAIAYLQAQFEASLTDEQRELKAAMVKGEQNNIERLARAKALIEDAQVSPSKAFVVRRSVKHAVNVEAERPEIFADAMDGKLPEGLLTIDEPALIKWIEDNPDTALDYGASVTRTSSDTHTVAFYAAKL